MKRKINEWIKRYLPAEILGTILALTGAGLAFSLTKNRILAAYSGGVGEVIGYYGFIFIREYLKNIRNSVAEGEKNKAAGFFKTTRNLTIEFGFSELLDGGLIRPFCMYIFPLIINEFSLGIFAGKIAADVVFYIPTITGYEFVKKRLN
jgi:hypothetical protein